MNNIKNNKEGSAPAPLKGKKAAKTSVVKPLPWWVMQTLEAARAAGFALPRKWTTDLPVIRF